MTLVPVLEVGGTHVSAALVDVESWRLAVAARRVNLDSHGDADEILAAFADVAADLVVPAGARWGVAMPDPFDYERGIAQFHGVGKFDALYGVDVGAELRARLPARPEVVVFCNDADAFTLGEWVAGAGQGSRRCVGITLGTGVGSGWVADGRIVDPGTPPGGRAHRLMVDGEPLEESMSRRAIRRAYRAATGDAEADVREIADRAGFGEPAAIAVLREALTALGTALGPAIRGFGADVVVVGGSMAASWSLFDEWFRTGCGPEPLPPVVLAADADAAPLLGAARAASTSA